MQAVCHLKEYLSSERGMRLCNVACLLCFLTPTIAIRCAVFIAWLLYLVYCIRKTKHKPSKIVYIALAILASIVLCFQVGTIAKEMMEEKTYSSGATLPGATEIYPTIMVNDTLYTWDKMADTLPDNLEYLAELEHIDGNTISENYQFISTFDITGSIYITPDTTESIYLLVSTGWIDQSYVVFSD